MGPGQAKSSKNPRMQPSRIEQSDALRISILAVVAAGLLLQTTFVWWHQDDLYIHLRYAYQLGHRGIWSFNGDMPSYGTTSPLWVIALAVFGFMKPIWAAKVLSIGSMALSISVFIRARQLFRDQWWFVVSLFSLGVNHWLRLASGSGMEANLAGAVVLIIVMKSYSIRNWTTAQSLLMGLLSGIAVLLRPEMAYLPVILLIAQLATKAPPWRIASMVLGGAAIVAPWLLYAGTTFGQVVPVTVTVKQGILQPSLGGIAQSLWTVGSFVLASNAFELLALGLGAALVLLAPKGGKSAARWLLPLGIVVGLLLTYTANQAFGGERISYRYAAPILPSLVLVGGICAERLAAIFIDRRSLNALARIVALMLILSSNAALDYLHLPFLRRSLNYVENVCSKYGVYLNKHANKDDKIACYDVGAIGFYSDRHILDLIGLVSPETLHLRVTAANVNDISALPLLKPRFYVLPWLGDSRLILAKLPPHRVLFWDTVYSYRMSWSTDNTPRQTALLRLEWDPDPEGSSPE